MGKYVYVWLYHVILCKFLISQYKIQILINLCCVSFYPYLMTQIPWILGETACFIIKYVNT